ncbi:hypothetical protein LCGC14_0395560 [marine sediment metagenome]|uniref:Uncharacterized protein n=1 Tax=marine sediment metagenome TaxID=412755 RepID=A0A0F9SYF1_9ZZZZ
MIKTVVILEHEKETPGTNRYKEVQEQGKLTLLNHIYLQKWVGNPSKIRVTVEEV